MKHRFKIGIEINKGAKMKLRIFYKMTRIMSHMNIFFISIIILKCVTIADANQTQTPSKNDSEQTLDNSDVSSTSQSSHTADTTTRAFTTMVNGNPTLTTEENDVGTTKMHIKNSTISSGNVSKTPDLNLVTTAAPLIASTEDYNDLGLRAVTTGRVAQSAINNTLLTIGKCSTNSFRSVIVTKLAVILLHVANLVLWQEYPTGHF